MLKLLIPEVKDIYSQENFKRIQNFAVEHNILKAQWFFIEAEFTAAVTAQRFKHTLSFIPLDILQTYKTGAGSVTWEYDLFDRSFFYVTTSGACKVRAFLGRYQERSDF